MNIRKISSCVSALLVLSAVGSLSAAPTKKVQLDFARKGNSKMISEIRGYGLSVDMKVPDKSSLKTGSEAVFFFEWKNTGQESLHILRWDSPMEGLTSDMFKVTRNGQIVVYQGPVMKRAFPEASDFATLNPGVSIQSSVDVSKWYDLSEPGKYTIELNAGFLVVLDAKPLQSENRMGRNVAMKLKSKKITFTVKAKGKKPEPEYSVLGKPSKGDRYACDTQEEITATEEGLAAARAYSQSAVDFLNANSSGDHGEDFVAWFGSGDFSRIKSNFDAINQAMYEPMKLSCGGSSCSKRTYAYVYPSDTSRTIYLCGIYFSTTTWGYDARADTIVHEISHFATVANTDDHQYGQCGNQTLATTDSSRAVDNADSNAYFSADTNGQTRASCN